MDVLSLLVTQAAGPKPRYEWVQVKPKPQNLRPLTNRDGKCGFGALRKSLYEAL